MNRQEFEELELQVQQSELPLKSYLQQIGVSYSTYHYWRRKCSVDRSSIKHELAPISFKQAFTESSQEEQLPHGVALLFPNGLRAHFGITIFLSTGICIEEEYWNCDFNAGAIRSAYSFLRLAVLLIT